MTMASVSRVSGFHSPSTTPPPPATTARAIPTYQRADRSAAWDRTLVRASLLAIVAVADITLVAWVFPAVQTVAELLGVSSLEAIQTGAVATLASVPIVVTASMFFWRQLVRKI